MGSLNNCFSKQQKMSERPERRRIYNIAMYGLDRYRRYLLLNRNVPPPQVFHFHFITVLVLFCSGWCFTKMLALYEKVGAQQGANKSLVGKHFHENFC